LPQAFEILERHPSEIPLGEAFQRLASYDLLERSMDRLRSCARVQDVTRLCDEVEIQIERRSLDHPRICIEVSREAYVLVLTCIQ